MRLEENRRGWEARQNEATAHLAEQSQQVAAQQAELESHERTLAERQRQWHADREQCEGQLAKQAEDLRGREIELKARDDGFAQRCRQESRTPLHAQPAADKRNDEAKDEHAGGRQSEAAPAPPPPPATEPARPGASPAAPRHRGGDEESIDDYMTRLLQRLRKEQADAPARRRRPVAGEAAAPKAAPEPPSVVKEKPVEAKPADSPAPAPRRRSIRRPRRQKPRRVRCAGDAREDGGDSRGGQLIGWQRHRPPRPPANAADNAGEADDRR